MARIVEQFGNRFAASRIARQDDIAADVAFDAMNMELLIKFLHGKPLLNQNKNMTNHIVAISLYENSAKKTFI